MIKIPYLKETVFGENVVFDGVKGFLSQLSRQIAHCSSPRSLAGWCFCIGWWRIAGGKGCCSISAWHFGALCSLWWSELWSSWPTYTASRLTALQSCRTPSLGGRFWCAEFDGERKSALWLPAGAWEVASWMSTTSWWWTSRTFQWNETQNDEKSMPTWRIWVNFSRIRQSYKWAMKNNSVFKVYMGLYCTLKWDFNEQLLVKL